MKRPLFLRSIDNTADVGGCLHILVDSKPIRDVFRPRKSGEKPLHLAGKADEQLHLMLAIQNYHKNNLKADKLIDLGDDALKDALQSTEEKLDSG